MIPLIIANLTGLQDVDLLGSGYGYRVIESQIAGRNGLNGVR